VSTPRMTADHGLPRPAGAISLAAVIGDFIRINVGMAGKQAAGAS